MNIIKQIKRANAGRDPERTAMKYRAIRASPFIFLRGTCHLFYERLAKLNSEMDAPLVWCCGDLHLENFGSYKGDNRLVYFDINDFDEAALGPATWELVRFLASVFIGVREFGSSRINDASLAQTFLDSYASCLVHGKARWVERETASGIVKDLLEQLRMRKRVDLLNSRTKVKGKHRRFLNDGRKTLPVTEEDRIRVVDLMEKFAARQSNPDFYRVLDVSRRIAGTGSLGVARYAILIEGKGSPDQNYLLDLKRAGGSSIGTHFTSLQPKWPEEAARVVEIERRLQAVPTAFLHPLRMEGHSYVLRALQPVEDRLPLAGFHKHPELVNGAMQLMGDCVAWAHLRSSGREGSAIADELIDFGRKNKWRVRLLNQARHMAEQTTTDWASYCEAYDSGDVQAPL